MDKIKKLEKIFEEIDVAKEKLLASETDLEINFWNNYKTLCELELSQVEIGG